MKKRILLVVPSLEIGGRERIAVNTAQCLLEDYEVEIAVFQNRKVACYEAPCRVININSPAKGSLVQKVMNQIQRSRKLINLRNRGKYDYVFSFGNAANISNALSGIFSKGKTICAIHGFSEVKKGFQLSLILKKSDVVICIAKAMEAKLIKLYPKYKRFQLIENGYDLTRFDVECRHELRGNQDVVFASMGRLEHVKGFDLLIQAFHKVHMHLPNARLWLIGEGSQRDELEERVNSLHIAPVVKFWGYQKMPDKILRMASIYVLSSRNEGLPNALIEALNVGLPVIAIDCESGPREILTGDYTKKNDFNIEIGKYGVLVENFLKEEKKVDYLAEAMINMACDKKMQSIFCSCAQNRAKEYSLDVYAAKVKAMLESI